ncbi:MAG: VanZ family protein [Proteobacteria bacterium]|nr:VanZ family protein [Pseudomonadota bacterium]
MNSLCRRWETHHPTMRIAFPLFLCLAAFTIFVHLYARQYEPQGKELLVNPDFRQGLSGWKGHPDSAIPITANGELLIENSDPIKSVILSQTLAAKQIESPLLLKGKIKTEDVTAGRLAWNLARVVITSLGPTGKWLPGTHASVEISGNTNWTPFSTVFHIPEGAEKILVRIELNQATGKLFAKDLSLRMAQESSLYAFSRWPMLIGWAVFLLILATPYFKTPKKNVTLSLIVLGVGLLVLAGTTVPGPYKDLVVRYLSSLTYDISGFSMAKLPMHITKIGHFTGFLLLGLFSCLCFVQEKPTRIFVDLILLALASEFMQFFTVERTPLLGDVIIDCMGGLGGIIIATIILKLTSEARGRKSKNILRGQAYK